MTRGMRHPDLAQSNGMRARGSLPMSKATRHGEAASVVEIAAFGIPVNGFVLVLPPLPLLFDCLFLAGVDRGGRWNGSAEMLLNATAAAGRTIKKMIDFMFCFVLGWKPIIEID